MPTTQPTLVNRAAKFEVEELFFSTTDQAGRIKTCNDVFLRLAGYPIEELLGSPHSIVRHPDMPRCVFRLFWEELEAGRTFGAYVKNRTAEGEFYWVFALAFPVDDGYMSLRFKPTSERLKRVEEVYRLALAAEAAVPARNEDAIVAGSEVLLPGLLEITGPDYTTFMVESLREELAARFDAMRDRGLARMRSPAAVVLAQLGVLDTLAIQAGELSCGFHELSDRIHRVALNSAVCAARLGSDAAALGALSDQVARVASSISDQASALESERAGLAPIFSAMGLQAALVLLATEISETISQQRARSCKAETDDCGIYGVPPAGISDLLDSLVKAAGRRAQVQADDLRGCLRRFGALAEAFQRVLLTTTVTHVTGRAVASSVPGGEHFSTLLADMQAASGGALERLEDLEDLIRTAGEAAAAWKFR